MRISVWSLDVCSSDLLRVPPKLDDVLGRHHDFLDKVNDVLEVGLLAYRLGDLLLETGIGVDHVPARRHRQPPSPSSVRMPNDSIWSTTKKKMAAADRKSVV